MDKPMLHFVDFQYDVQYQYHSQAWSNISSAVLLTVVLRKVKLKACYDDVNADNQ